MEEKIMSNDISEAIETKPVAEPITVVPPERFELSVRDKVFALLLGAACIVMSAFGIWGGFAAGYSVSVVIITVIASVYLGKAKAQLNAFNILCGILTVSTACIFAVTTNGSVKFFGFYAGLLLMLGWFSSFARGNSERGDLGLVFTLLRPIYELAIPCIPTTVRSLFESGGQGKKTFLKVLLGMAVALPVLIVVVPLLMQSDEAFSGLAKQLFGDLFITLLKIILGLLLALVIVPFCFAVKKKELTELRGNNFKGVDNTVIISFLSVISVCYIAYLFSQLAYFFSAFKGFLPDDYTFNESEYARRGFFEMSIIAAINLAVIFTVLIISLKNKKQIISLASRLLCTFIGLFTLIIIATAISKMVLYISEYGMTVLRITTSAFMLFLAVVFISLMMRLFLPNIKVLRTALITAGIVLTILGTVNVNRVVATYNYEAYEKNMLKEIDVYTIYELGDEGVPYLVKLANGSNAEVAEIAKEKLIDCIDFGDYYEYEAEYNGDYKTYKLGKRKNDGIGQFNFSRNAAYNALEEYIKENPDFLTVKTYSESSAEVF